MSASHHLEWREGVPISARFDDPYFSLENGLAETRHVFLAGNDLPARFQPGFQIAELGFGTGLNLLTAWMSWQQAGVSGPLHYTSFEAFPLSAEETTAALSSFHDAFAQAEPLLDALKREETRIETDTLIAEIIVGDARETLPHWAGQADAWFLDGFSPAKNPELWEEALMREVARHTRVGGSFATYTAAGHVRRALEAAGFEVTRLPGYGRKRHMSAGKLVSGSARCE